jgi:nitroreductase
VANYHYEVTSLPVDETLFYRRVDFIQRLRFLTRYAHLAPSTYNSQPWKFRIHLNQIWVYADSSRWFKIADSDKREMFLSLGCAIENLQVAADHYSFKSEIKYFPDPYQPELVAILEIHGCENDVHIADAAMLQAITARRSCRGKYQHKPLKASHWALIESCVSDDVLFLDSRQMPKLRDKLAELMPLAFQVLYNDRAYMNERKRSLQYRRENLRAIHALVRKAIPIGLWGNLGKRLGKIEQDLILNAPGLFVLSVKQDTPEMQVKAGRVFQRMSLIATTLGISMQVHSQIIELPELRSELREFLRRQGHPVMILRMGHSNRKLGSTPRRPLEDVLI